MGKAHRKSRSGSRTPAPKGRPTVGRKQQRAAARKRARRRTWAIRATWITGALLFVGLLVLLVVTGWGAGEGQPVGG